MKTCDTNDQQRLMAYLAAAGLGAFAFGQDASAGIVYTPVDPAVTLVQYPGTPSYFNLDFNNDGTIESAILNTGVNMQARSFPPARTLTSTGSYYVFSFAAGELIDGNAAFSGGANLMINPTYGYNFVGTGGYIGFQFDIDGSTHYGWAQVDVTLTPQEAVITGYAYESTPNTGIVAGAIPEPTSLALLAAGAGALGLRRRSAA
ncbi:PEP-CTERM sorting domain-containing protein [Mucisphaera sp.]|uniref:PEP-CTERM sorting domain-containing protein n=1 Tax=Mucisphaera sp. TaxID=2913024 RepID=UPI003D146A34